MSDPGDSGLETSAQAEALLRSIGARAQQTNLVRIAELGEAVRRASQDALPDAARQRAVDIAHQLVGSAGTFGYDRVSETARELEQSLLRDSFADERVVRAATAGLELMSRELTSGRGGDFD